MEPVVTPALKRFPILRFFAWAHLPAHLQGPSKAVSELAHAFADAAPDTQNGGQETAAGLRKLLEAKDCFVRAILP